MKNHFFALGILVCLNGACNDPKPAGKGAEMPGNQEGFAEMLAQYQEDRYILYPLEATYAGDKRFNHSLPNSITEAHRQKLRDFYTRYRQALQGYDRQALSADERISYDVLLWECDINLKDLEFPKHLMPINQFESLHLTIGQLATGSSAQPFETVKDYDDWLSRLDMFTAWCDTAIVNMQKGMAQGYVLPKVLVAKMVPQFADLAQLPVEKHLFYTPVSNMPDSFPAAEKERLTAAYREMLAGRIIPAFTRLRDFVKNEYLPACRATAGISEVPGGAALYAHQIKTYTTTELTADEVFNVGMREVERIQQEMDKVKARVGFQGDLKAFFDHVRTLPKLMPFTDPQQVIDNFNAIHEKMKPNLARLFDLTPKTAFEVRRTEAFREASASAEYVQGSVDGTRPGIFYVPIPNVKEYNLFSDEDLFLHEAIPGHHYQISLQQENTALPSFRRTLWYSAYGEGWALYTESLGEELGLYTDPYQYFGMLSAEMHRAIRLVVDAGMHAKGWTREEAIRFSLDHEAESEASIISEIERYMAWPGQALSYKMGQLKIRELRTLAKNQMGDRFDIKAFHNRVLESGCVPLAVLEAKIMDWIGQ
jgi:uncharacterized protein (DUF885 family)